MVNFFTKYLKHSIGRWAGQTFTLLPWQKKDVITPLFGWVRPDGKRRFKKAYIEIPKKNGKSTLCSGLALYLLCGDGEPGAQVFSAATDRDQASIIYREAAAMVQASEQLSVYLDPIRTTKTITFNRANAFYRAISADSYRQQGLNIHGLIFDELHAQRTRELWDALRYGGRARENALSISITTAGWDRNSICWEQHERAIKILDNSFDDPTFFPYIRSADVEDDWTKPSTWRKANPSLGHIVQLKDIRADCEEAKDMPSKENSFKRYTLNIWTEQAVRWMQMDQWDACVGDVDAEALVGCRCWAGLDLASVQDLTAFVLVFPVGDKFKVLPFFWVPADNVREREMRDRVPYGTWAKEGFIELTPGKVTDQERVFARILELGKKYDIQNIAFDAHNAGWMHVRLDDAGFDVLEHPQFAAAMNEPTKLLQKCVLNRTLEHGGHKVLRWNASNAAIRVNASDDIKLDKQRSTEKIDGVVALVMALGRASCHLDNNAKSVYEDRGVIFA